MSEGPVSREVAAFARKREVTRVMSCSVPLVAVDKSVGNSAKKNGMETDVRLLLQLGANVIGLEYVVGSQSCRAVIDIKLELLYFLFIH